ncbi:SET domain-containing protein 5 [Termitomyces sp. T112]|nr:SET domain-containing protein 5 [Termitomyces sp. T112]
MSSSPSSSYFTTHTLTYLDAPDSPTSLLVDKRIVPYLPIPKHPSRLTPLGEDGTTCFKIRPAGPDKGLGMFATRHIPTGSLIYVEHPAIFAPAEVPLTGKARSSAYHSLSEVLPQHRRDELHTMANCRSSSECALEEGILCTNALALELGLPDDIDIEAREYGGVFLTINRCNHSCGPNAAHKWDLASFSTSLYALRPIAPGEEITIIYTDVTQSRDTRRARLSSHYGFTCLCSFCTLPSPLLEESDATRAALRDWRHTRPTFTGWATDLCRSDDFVLQSHMDALTLIEKENLQGMASVFVRDVCSCWAMLGEEDEFKKWAERLLELCEIRDITMAREVRGWLVDPKSKVPKWGWRKKQRTRM